MCAPRSRTARAARWLIALCFCAGCAGGGEHEGPAHTQKGALPFGTVARVGGDTIAAATVARIASQQELSPREALDRALSDALFARGARERAATGVVRSIERAAAARAMLERLKNEAVERGPVTDGELLELRRERWTELERPDAVVTTHAVVMFTPEQREQRSQAREVATQIASAVAKAADSAQFIKLAEAVPRGKLKLRAETLPPVTRDGRSFAERDGQFLARSTTLESDFARAAHELADPGQLSPVVETRFGFHVIRLDRKIAGRTLELPELRRSFSQDVLMARAREARGKLLASARETRPVEIMRSVDELTARIEIEP
jgi:peptidyl-prolyl cis-trans isomerase C